jgi:hypothetical protein
MRAEKDVSLSRSSHEGHRHDMTTPNYSPRDHLLGRLEGAGLDAADEKSISDPAYFEELTAEEQVLVEEYVSGALPAADRRDFEREISLRPELHERVLLERMNRKRIFAAGRNIWIRTLLPLAAAITVIAIGTAVYLQHQLVQQKNILAEREHDWKSREASQHARIAQLESLARNPETRRVTNGPKNAPHALLPIVATFLIKPFTLGESDERHFAVAAVSGRVELQFNIGTENRFTTYRILITDERGKVVSRATAKPEIVEKRANEKYRVVSATVPANVPAGQHFEVSVFGIATGKPDELLANYAFVLDRK